MISPLHTTLFLGLPWELPPASHKESLGMDPNFYWIVEQTIHCIVHFIHAKSHQPISQLRKTEVPEVRPTLHNQYVVEQVLLLPWF